MRAKSCGFFSLRGNDALNGRGESYFKKPSTCASIGYFCRKPC
jgi:hypothetical protein